MVNSVCECFAEGIFGITSARNNIGPIDEYEYGIPLLRAPYSVSEGHSSLSTTICFDLKDPVQDNTSAMLDREKLNEKNLRLRYL